MAPKLSIILPVYNGLPYLAEAINSILHQTLQDFELIIINDGSTDGSGELIGQINDARVRYYRQSNRGLAATLNRGIALARGQYIARQDQDDVSFPLRLEKQAGFLDAHPDVGMVGMAAEIWVGDVRTDRQLRHPSDDASIRFGLLFDNYFVHSSVMIRRSVLEEVGGYSEDLSRQPPEDYELWSRVMRSYQVANLPEVLMAYRELPGSMSRSGVNPFLSKLVKISAENIAWAVDCPVNSREVVALAKLMHGDYRDMPRGARLKAMISIMQAAAQRIVRESHATPEQIMLSLRSQMNRLRYRYVDYRCGGLIGMVVHSHIGRYVRSLVSQLSGRGH